MLHLPSASPGDHLCALADDLGELETLASIFLDEGRLLGEQTLSLDAATALRRYPGHDREIDPTVAWFMSRSDDAVAAGYTGLRVATDVSLLLDSEEARDRYGRYEVAIERAMRTHGRSTGICLARRDRSTDGFDEVLCALHVVSVPDVGFHLCWDPVAQASRLSGEIDLATAPLLERVLGLLPSAERWVLDLSACRYLDHHGIRAMERVARRRGAMIELINASPIVVRLLHLLESEVVVVAGRPG